MNRADVPLGAGHTKCIRQPPTIVYVKHKLEIASEDSPVFNNRFTRLRHRKTRISADALGTRYAAVIAGMIRASLATTMLAGSVTVLAAESYMGDARSKDGALLYREQHLLYREQDGDARLVMYVCPDGKPFARKHIWYGKNQLAPDFAMEDARSGFAEGARSDHGARRIFVRDSSSAPERTAPLNTAGDTVADAGFDNFVRAHWDGLAPGASLPLSFVVPSKLTTFDFRVSSVGDETIDGVQARRFRLGLARWYGGFLPHIDVLYDAQSHELLRYEGISNIRGNDGRNLDVRISFPAKPKGVIDDGAVASAAAAALNGSCKL